MLLGLENLLDRKPAHLSGGQRQRVAMGRAIIREPVAFLMDEPLSNLDAKLRVGMRASLAQLHARLSVTSIYVTHDQTEAMTLGQRVAVMRDGRVVQVDVPQRLYQSPNDLFVAAFIGSPSMNLVEATVENDTIVFGQFRVPLSPARRPPHGVAEVVLGIRPEVFGDAAFSQTRLPRIEVTVDVLEELGSDSHVFFHVAAPRVTIETRDATSDDTTILAEKDSLFTARVDPATRARAGQSLTLAINPAKFHFFDLVTGESLLLADAGRQAAHEEALP
jgi:multiple sugar transport system ATP-binding protein